MNNTKTILYLLNGLGVASKDTFDLKINTLMPNLNMLMTNYLYTNIENVAYNYKNGYRVFSLGNDLLPTYHMIENDENFENNKKILNIVNDINRNNTKLQIFCFLDNEKVINHIIKLVNLLCKNGEFPIYIHIILRQKDYLSYDNIMKMIKQLIEKLTLIKNVNIGAVVGELKINTEIFYELMTKKTGEKWPDYNRKLNYSKMKQINPRELDAFYVNEGFRIEANDVSLFMNYEDVECDELIKRISNTKLYCLFPMKSYPYAVKIYDEVPPVEYFSKFLEERRLKCLILTTESRIPILTYGLCGLNNEKSPYIEYMDINDQNIDKIKVIDNNYHYIIYDYDIGIYKDIKSIKEFLIEKDEEIEGIYKHCTQNDFNLYIASLYGLYKDYIIGVNKIAKLDYTKEVPVISINNKYSASKYTFKYGNTHDLSNTIFSAITNDDNIKTLYRKKGLLSIFKD